MLYPNGKRILAIDLRSRSFGFAVFEGPTRLIDWGARSFRQGINAVKVPASLKFAGLMDEFYPSAIVVRKGSVESRKKAGMRQALVIQAEKHRIPVRLLSRRVVKKAFVGSNRNKYTIAAAIVKQLPELAPRLPSLRKIWKSEDYRMSIFDAAALGVAYFTRRKPITKGGDVHASRSAADFSQDQSCQNGSEDVADDDLR
jgi:hypothetical protein